jgi:hypothetical protein
MSDVSSFISDLKSVSQQNTVKITVPSINKVVEFKSLTVKQQKDALKASLSGPQGTLLFFNTLNNIIEENSQEKINFTIQDRVYIIIQLRNYSLGASYKKNDKVYDLSTSFKELTPVKGLTVNYKGIEVTLSIPTLAKDTTINSKCVQEIKNKQAEDIADVIDVLYAYEIIKFIKDIELNEVKVDFEALSFKEKRSLVDELPLALNKEILTAITQIKSYDDNYLQIDGEDLVLDVSLLTSD